MRLLQFDESGRIILGQYHDGDIPPYAILSHRWGALDDEVTFRELRDGTGVGKIGYQKIQCCGEQARRDGLQHFWVDTCCIDKSDASELGESINSMFRWYQDAARCYVYLADVKSPAEPTNGADRASWEMEFRKSDWFSRGWTLQELIAPSSVEFYTKSWESLGDKAVLERQVCQVTHIPARALRGQSLDEFSVEERMSWMLPRETFRQEDKAYAMLGIFDVHMSLIYSEGRENAMNRLKAKISRKAKGKHRADFSITFSLSSVNSIQKFVARQEELGEMHRHLSGDGSRHTVILQGLGGMGKTQLAVEYIKQHRDDYSAIFWLNIKDADAVRQSFVKVARNIIREYPTANHLKDIDLSGDLEVVVDAVKAWLGLSQNTRWLVVYDNYDNPKVPANRDASAVDIRDFIPDAYHGSIIITTRSLQVRSGHCMPVTKLCDPRDSLEILATVSQRADLVDSSDAKRLVEKLDGLPLALATAGAYLYQSSMNTADYIRLYDKSWAKLLQMSPELDSYEDRTLYSTWQVSFDQVERRNSLAARLLQFWAYFDSQDLWFQLLCHTKPGDPEWIREIVEDELSFIDVMRVLSDHGLVEVDSSSSAAPSESRGYSIHGCVHSWIVSVLNRNWNSDLAALAMKFIAMHVPDKTAHRPWLIQRRLLQHATRCVFMVSNNLVAVDGLAWAFYNLGSLYQTQGQAVESEAMYQHALKGYEMTRGPDHLTTLDTVNSLGRLHDSQDRLVEAEAMYERALKGKEMTCGPDHLSTLETVNNLGSLYIRQGKLVEAEAMYERALKGVEMLWGPDHCSALETVNNLGLLYERQDRLIEAEAMLERALKGKEMTYGPDHSSTLETMNNLGSLYESQGMLAEAEAMYQRVLKGYEITWGPNHPSTLDTVNNFGILYMKQGKLLQAEAMYERALQGKEMTLGPNHSSTLGTVNNLGLLYMIQGRLVEAAAEYERALKGYEMTWESNTSTLNTVNNFGILYERQGRLAEAEAMFQRALKGKELTWGPDHSSTVETVSNLVILHAKQGKLVDAKAEYQRALDGHTKHGRPERGNFLAYTLGCAYRQESRLAEAELTFKCGLSSMQKLRHDTTTFFILLCLADLKHSQGEPAAAEDYYNIVLEGYGKVGDAGKDFDRVHDLGCAYLQRGWVEEADVMFEQEFESKQNPSEQGKAPLDSEH